VIKLVYRLYSGSFTDFSLKIIGNFNWTLLTHKNYKIYPLLNITRLSWVLGGRW